MNVPHESHHIDDRPGAVAVGAKEAPRVAVITGAGSGIGRATAALLAEADFALCLVGRAESKLQKTAELLTSIGDTRSRIVIVSADISRQAEANRVIDETMS